jgi:hypothetical protein
MEVKTSIKLELNNGKTLRISEEEARQLQDALNELFGNHKYLAQYYPYWYFRHATYDNPTFSNKDDNVIIKTTDTSYSIA